MDHLEKSLSVGEALNTTVGELFGTLRDEASLRKLEFPKKHRGFADELRRLVPTLKESGFKVEFIGKKKKGYTMRVTRLVAKEA
jgi:hypothetical protein